MNRETSPKTARPEVLAGWRGLLEQLDPEEREPMRQLLVLHRQQRELYQRLRLQKRYKNLLEIWLYLPLPLSVVLVLLIAAHVVAVFFETV